MRLIALFILLLSITSCATSGSNKSKIYKRFAAEYDCSEVSVKEIDFSINRGAGSYVVEGCGKRSFFVCDMGTCVKNNN